MVELLLFLDCSQSSGKLHVRDQKTQHLPLWFSSITKYPGLKGQTEELSTKLV
jgi:hypothetical protein